MITYILVTGRIENGRRTKGIFKSVFSCKEVAEKEALDITHIYDMDEEWPEVDYRNGKRVVYRVSESSHDGQYAEVIEAEIQ